MRLRDLSDTAPLIAFGGGMFDPENTNRFADGFPDVDVFCVGDGRKLLRALVRRKAGKAKQGRLAIGGPPSCRTNWRLMSQDSPSLPAISRMHRRSVEPVVLSSIGCNWGRCQFCHIPDRSDHTQRSPKSVADELLWLHQNLGVREAVMGDLDVTSSPERVGRLRAAFAPLADKIQLWGMVSSRYATTRVFKDLREAGFAWLQCGTEALDQTILDRMDKGTSVLQNVMAMKLAHELRFKSFYAPLLKGFPGETRDEVVCTLDVVRAIKHLLKSPVQMEVNDCLVYRTSPLASYLSRLRPDDPYQSERCLAPGANIDSSASNRLWAAIEREIAESRKQRGFLIAKCDGRLTRVVDGRYRSPKVKDFHNREKEAVDLLLDGPRAKRVIYELLGDKPGRIFLEDLRSRHFLLHCRDWCLMTPIRRKTLGRWEPKR